MSQDPKRLAAKLALGRIVLGASALVLTRTFLTVLAGRSAAQDRVTRIAVRMYGVRELALGVAQVRAVVQDHPVEQHLRLGLLVDTVDAAVIFGGRRALPGRGTWIGAGIAAGYAAAEALALLGPPAPSAQLSTPTA